MREVIADGGLTFRAGDPHDLAAKIDEMLAGRGSREFVARGRARMTALYSWPRIGAAVDAAYGHALEHRIARRTVLTRGRSWG